MWIGDSLFEVPRVPCLTSQTQILKYEDAILFGWSGSGLRFPETTAARRSVSQRGGKIGKVNQLRRDPDATQGRPKVRGLEVGGGMGRVQSLRSLRAAVAG